MDYLDNARKSLELVMRHVKAGDVTHEQIQKGLLIALVDAAIATAEAAQRQAAAMERVAAALDKVNEALYAQTSGGGTMESVAQYLAWIYEK